MPLTMRQQSNSFELLEGKQTDDEPRGVEKMLSDFARGRDRLRFLLDNLTGFDAETGLFTVKAGTGTHNDMVEATALASLDRARNVMRTAAAELDAYLEGFEPDRLTPAADGEQE